MMKPPPLPQPEPLGINQAVRVYWKNLIGMAAYPPIQIIGSQAFEFSFIQTSPIFFGAMFAALWPWWKKRVSIDFWGVAMLIGMVSFAVFGGIAFALE